MNPLSSLTAFADTWWTYVLHSTWQSSLVVIAAFAFVWLRRKRSASFLYAVLVVVLLKFLVPPIISVPVIESPVNPFPAIEAPFGVSLPDTAVDSDPSAVEHVAPVPTADLGSRPTTSVSPPPVASSRSQAEASVQLRRMADVLQNWKVVLALVHFAGAGLLALLMISSYLHLQKLLHNSRPAGEALSSLAKEVAGRLHLRHPVRVLVSPASCAPIATGIVKRRVLMPEPLSTLDHDELRAILAHELAHHRRMDPAFIWVEHLVTLIWWFNPLVWMLVRAIHRRREDCCDDVVLSLGLAGNRQYCETLLHAAKRLHRPFTLRLVFGCASRLHPMGQRLTRIMDTAVRRRTALTVSGLVGIVLMSFVLLPTFLPVAAESDETRTGTDETRTAEAPAEPVAASSTAGPTQTGAFSGVVRGVVTNGVTGEPVSGAFVAIDHTGDAGGANLERFNKEGLYVTAETDAEGRYALEGVAVRDGHPFYITAPGFVRYEDTLSLTPQQPEQEQQVRLRPGATIAVTWAGAGASDADVMLRLTGKDGRRFLPPRGDWPAWPYRFEAATGGQHEFADLGPGQFRVEAIKIQPGSIAYLGAAETELAEGETKALRFESQPRDTRVTIMVARDPYQLKEQPRTILTVGPELDVSLPPGYFVHPEDEHLGRILANAILIQPPFWNAMQELPPTDPATTTDLSYEVTGLPEGNYTAATYTVGSYPNFQSPAVYPRWIPFELKEHDAISVRIPWIEPKGPYVADASVRSGLVAKAEEETGGHPAAVTGSPVTVPAKAEPGQEWHHTGIVMTRGVEFELNAEGSILWDPKLRSVGPAGAGRTPNASCGRPEEFPMPDAPCGGLLGRIGEGQPFFVGEHTTVTGDGGYLFLTVNDRLREFGDNEGSFIVTVTPAGSKSSEAPPQLAVAGPRGKFLRFDGQNDYVLVPPAKPLDLSETLTISAWVRVEPGCSDEAPVLRRGDARPGYDPYMFGVYRDQMHLGAFRDSSINHDAAELVTAGYDNDWHYWTGVRDAEAGRLYLYRDGELVDEAPVRGPLQYGTESMGNEMGAIDQGQWSRGSNWGFFKGDIDQVSVWNVARKPEDIQREISEGIKPEEPGLAALWTFDEEGQNLKDSSPSGIIATLGSSSEPDENDPARVDPGAAPVQAAAAAPVPPSGALQPAVAPLESQAVIDALPGELIFKGTYFHRSRGGDLPAPSVVWIKKTGEGELIAASYLPSINETTVAYVSKQNLLRRYEGHYHGRDGQTSFKRFLDLADGTVSVTNEGGEKDGQIETLTVPPKALFMPNSRPDSYSAHMGFFQLSVPSVTDPDDVPCYDWDNSGKGMASYTIRMENKGKEEIAVPAGTFTANHIIETQLISGNTWYKKRAGHVTDYWVLDNGVIVRILRHREPYELQLLSVETPAELPGQIATQGTVPVPAASPSEPASAPVQQAEAAAPPPPAAPSGTLQPAVVPPESRAVVDTLPGELVFNGTYFHRSRGVDLPALSVLWLKRTGEGEVIAASYLPAFNETTVAYISSVSPGPGFRRYEGHYHGRDGRPPSERFLDLVDGTVTVTYEGGEKDGQIETLTVPPMAVFVPNSRPDSYTAHMAIVAFQASIGLPEKLAEVLCYDWDNTGKGMASYTVRMENNGKEEITVPAGTFNATHFVETHLTFGDTWYKKRPGHVTDYWVLDNGIVVRILRHREPYELQLTSFTSFAPLPGVVRRSETATPVMIADVPAGQ